MIIIPTSILNAGHGSNDPGACANGVIERDINKAVVLKAQELMQYNGITVETILDTPDVNAVIAKVNEIAKETKVGIAHSVHMNSTGTGNADGYEVYHSIFYGQGTVFAKILEEEFAKTGQNAHGTGDFSRKSSNGNYDYYGFIRDTIPSAIISEYAFLDNINDVEQARQIEVQARSIAKAHCRYYGIEYKEKFENQLIQSLSLTQQIKHLVMGKADTTVEQAEQYLHKINSNAPFYAQIYKEEGEKEGVNWSIAFSQSLKETNYFKFGGIALPEWNNFSGIGVTGIKYIPNQVIETQFVDGVTLIKDLEGKDVGVKFSNPRLGIKCQIQHLKAYSSLESLVEECIDPRFKFVQRNKAPYIEDYGNGIWASDKNNYGQEIVEIYNQIAKEVVIVETISKITKLDSGYIEGVYEGNDLIRLIIHASAEHYIDINIKENDIFGYVKGNSGSLLKK